MNALQKYTTYQLLHELSSRRCWFYTWSPETFRDDFFRGFGSDGMEPPTDDECAELCEEMENLIDERFYDMSVELLKRMREGR